MIRRISLFLSAIFLLHASTNICMSDQTIAHARKSAHWYSPAVAKVTAAASAVHTFCWTTPRRKAATLTVLGALIGLTAWLTKPSWLPLFYHRPSQMTPFLTSSEVTELTVPQSWSMLLHPGQFWQLSWIRALSHSVIHA